MASLSDLKRAWLIRQLGLTNPPLSEADLELQLYAQQVNGVAANKSFKTGRYYNPEYFTAPTTSAPALSLLTLMPFVVGKTATFDRISVAVTAVGAGSVIRMGIYNTLNGLPDGLELDAGTVDSSAATGFKEIVINKTLSPGLYWLAYVAQGGIAPTVTCFGTASNPYIAHTADPGANSYSNYTSAGVAGALAASPAVVVGGSTGSVRVLLRAA